MILEVIIMYISFKTSLPHHEEVRKPRKRLCFQFQPTPENSATHRRVSWGSKENSPAIHANSGCLDTPGLLRFSVIRSCSVKFLLKTKLIHTSNPETFKTKMPNSENL